MKTQEQHIIELVNAAGTLRTRDVMRAGIPTTVLSRMVKNGSLLRIGRGLYELPDAEVSEHHTLAEAARRMPRGVICLLSALGFHELTTELPFEVWMARKRGSGAAKSGSPRPRLFPEFNFQTASLISTSSWARNLLTSCKRASG